LEHLAQLGQERIKFDKFCFALGCAVNLAIDAIKVADFVGIEIHPHGYPARTPAQHRIDEPVVLKRTFVQGVELVSGHGVMIRQQGVLGERESFVSPAQAGT
jgi:hypothetical protein